MQASGQLRRYGHHIGGAAVAPGSRAYLPTEDPFTGEAWALIARGTAADAHAAVEAAERAFHGPWSRLSATERGRLLWKLGDLRAGQRGAPGRDRAARQRQARDRGASPRCATWATTSSTTPASPTRSQSAVIPTDKKGVFTYTRYEPKGVVAIITPWNSPLTLTSWKLAPGARRRLHRGGQAVRVHLGVDARVRRAVRRRRAFPKGVVNVVTGLGPEVGRGARHASRRRARRLHRRRRRRPQGLRARGARPEDRHAGARRQVAEHRVRRRRPATQAVKGVVSGIFAASGQTCLAGSRLLVQRTIHDRFVEKLVDFVRGAKLGDPALPDTQIGPIATRPQFEKVLRYIDIAKDEGARCVLGGSSRPGPRRRPVRRADDLHRRAQRHAHRAGRGLRPGAGGDSVRGRGRRDRASATTSPTAWPPGSGPAACIARCC